MNNNKVDYDVVDLNEDLYISSAINTIINLKRKYYFALQEIKRLEKELDTLRISEEQWLDETLDGDKE